MLILVPREYAGKELKVEQFRHPKTNEPANFVASDRLYQVVELSTPPGDTAKYRAFFVEAPDNKVNIHNGQLHLMIPVNPVFLLLPTLFSTNTLPIDVLLDLASGDWQTLDPQLARPALEKVCDIDDDMVTLNRGKLDGYLLSLVEKVPVSKTLTPRELDDEFLPLYQKNVGIDFISSWLPPKLEQHLRSLVDLSALEQHVATVVKKRDEANTIYLLNQKPQAKKRAAPASTKAAKKAAPVKNNRSLLDMFGKK